ELMKIPDMPIAVVCPSCGVKMRAPESAAGRKTKCRKCGTALVVPKPAAEHATPPPMLLRAVAHPQSTPAPFNLQAEPTSAPLGEEFDFSAAREGASPAIGRESLRATVPGPVPAIQQLDIPTKIGLFAAVLGLLLLGVSPLFHWVNLAS